MKPIDLVAEGRDLAVRGPAVGLPSISTTPEVGGSMQPIMLRMVDLPEPDGPAMEMKSPFSMAKVTPFTASTSPSRGGSLFARPSAR